MDFRSMFNKMTGGTKAPPKDVTVFKSLSGVSAIGGASFAAGVYDDDISRACIDVIARNAAKLEAKHIRRAFGDVQTLRGNLAYLLNVRPNPYMSAYDMLYKTVAQLFTTNNAYIFIQRTPSGDVLGFYPVLFQAMELVEHGGEMFCRFHFGSGERLTCSYADVIHLRRHYNRNDLLGESNDRAFAPTLSLIQSMNEGIKAAIKSSATLRGWLKFSNVLRPEDQVAQQRLFVENFLTAKNSGGIGVVDGKADFIPAKLEPVTADDKQMQMARDNVYRYFGVNEKILTAAFNEDEWAAFYESVIEPVAIQLSLECTAKLFTDRERGHGNEIVFEANRMQYASTQTKVNMIEKLAPIGLLTINEGREIFNLAPVEGGDRRMMSLNFIDADRANEYQVGDDMPPPTVPAEPADSEEADNDED